MKDVLEKYSVSSYRSSSKEIVLLTSCGRVAIVGVRIMENLNLATVVMHTNHVI